MFSVAGAAEEACPLDQAVSYSSKDFDSWRARAVRLPCRPDSQRKTHARLHARSHHQLSQQLNFSSTTMAVSPFVRGSSDLFFRDAFREADDVRTPSQASHTPMLPRYTNNNAPSPRSFLVSSSPTSSPEVPSSLVARVQSRAPAAPWPRSSPSTSL